MPTRLALTLLVCSTAALIFGCNSKEEVKVYTAARTSAPHKPLDAKLVASLLDHTLAAIIPQGDIAWFFKLAGPAPALDRHREAFYEFLATVKLGDKSTENPSWTLPETWEEKPASQMRIATLLIPDKQGPLEIAVSSLPYSGDWQAFLVPNVNRWLGQLQEKPLDAETILKLAKKVKLTNATATCVELVGRAPKKKSNNPHAGVPGAPPIGAPSPTPKSVASKALAYETPEGWLPGRVSSMRKAAFRVVQDEAQAEITVIDLPASGGTQVTDVQANMRRWAGQAGITDLDDDQLQKLIQPITIDATEGSYAEFVSPESPDRRPSIYAAMVVHQGKVWFFKMTGDTEIVIAQQKAFREFLDSVKFNGPAN